MQIFRGDGIGKCGGTFMEEEWVVPKISAPLDCLISRMPCSKGVIICKAFFFSYFLMASCLFNQVSHEKKGKK